MKGTSPREQYANRYAILAAVMLTNIMGPIDASIVNVTLPTIAQYFGAGLSAVQWVPMTYLLVLSSLLLFYGRLGDILGYRRIYLTGLASFVIASALCGFSYFFPTIYWLVAFRAIQGLAAAMMMAVSLAIITASFPPTELGKSLGIYAISIAVGLAIGPSVGGFITSAWGWPFVFMINIPIGIAGFFWARRIIPALKGQPGKIDMGGALTSFISLSSLLLFVNYWQQGGFSIVAGILLGVAILAALGFVWIERLADQPMLNLDLFRNLTFSFATVSALLNFMSQFVLVFLTPFYLQRLLHYAPNTLGLTMTAFPLAVMVVAPFSGSLSDRLGTGILACLGAAISACALFLMSRLPPVATSLDVVWRLAVFGLGAGIFQSPNNSAVMGSAPRPQLGMASGILATVRNVGMVFGIATGGAVLYALVSPGTLQQPTLIGKEAAEFLFGLRHAYLVGALLAGAAAATSLFRVGHA
ncbi:MAG: MFS transporter [Desulfobacterales bacterium]|nr:MFS transporter [Desulfobacterales bacterium]